MRKTEVIISRMGTSKVAHLPFSSTLELTASVISGNGAGVFGQSLMSSLRGGIVVGSVFGVGWYESWTDRIFKRK